MKTFSQIPDIVILSDRLSDKAFRLYCKLKKFEHLQTKECFPSYKTLGMRLKTISKCLKELESLGLLKVDRANGRKNKYFISEHLNTRGESATGTMGESASGFDQTEGESAHLKIEYIEDKDTEKKNSLSKEERFDAKIKKLKSLKEVQI